MKSIEFGLNIPNVVTFLSKKSEPYTKMTQWGEKTYHNYTVILNKINGSEINEKRVLAASDYLETFLAAKNVLPGSYAKITMIEKGNGHTGWVIDVAKELKDVQEEEPGEPDEKKAILYTELMKDICNELIPFFATIAEANHVSIEAFTTCINTTYMSAVHGNALEI